ncbi:alpha-galactosidase [Butyrivibrio sp. JL13D10]|uniref:alpha-galactosidase n=1 Tax=Butyrivibrio sp. JL13D10 TaxID=3236815 RepID=UPI0038B5F05A
MGITYNVNGKQFHLFNAEISYFLGICPDGEVGQLYFGKKINENQTIAYGQTKGVRPVCCNTKEDENYTKELAMLEYPAFGNGDFRTPAYEIRQSNGSRVTNLIYREHRIYSGKKPIEGLPASYANTDDEATTLEIVCFDEIAKVEVTLFYTIWEKYPVICRHAKINNLADDRVVITKALSMCLDLPDSDYNWLQFEGAWGRERYPVERSLSNGITQIESMRGHSSANYNPFVIVKRKNTDEFMGEAIGINFVYSGNFVAESEADTYGKLRLLMGINPRWFEWPLDKGESFETPEVIISYSKEGLNKLSQSIHAFMNNNLVRGRYKNAPRPILLNNWEATEMNFNEEKILKIAKKGKEAGVELFVLDDGWFGKRNDDYAGLGDWFVNNKKLPDGLKGLSEKVNDLGLDFGVWIEPEMVNEDSDLYRAHPDWVLGAPDRTRTLGRHQMVLDFSKKEVVDNIYEQLYAAFSEANISYIKWDMNRSITECYSLGGDPSKEGMVYHKYIMGVYDLYERLIKAFPDILFESCASGGSRFDAGILYYAPQAWCSDDTDAHERIKIQYGTSYGYPVSMVGAHVSASPNLQTGRNIRIDERAAIACFGTFGYELDLNEISDEEFDMVKEQIKFMKEYRSLFQYGSLYRLESPFKKNISAWMVVSKDKETSIVAIYKNLKTPNVGQIRIRLKGLDPDGVYKINDQKEAYGDILMEGGVQYPEGDNEWFFDDGDFSSRIYVLKKNVTK